MVFHRKKISRGMGLRRRPLLVVLLPLSQLPRLVPLMSEFVLARLLLRLSPLEGEPGRKRCVEEAADIANENDDCASDEAGVETDAFCLCWGV